MIAGSHIDDDCDLEDVEDHESECGVQQEESAVTHSELENATRRLKQPSVHNLFQLNFMQMKANNVF